MYPHMSGDRHMYMDVDVYSYVPRECMYLGTYVLMYIEAYMLCVGCVFCVFGSMHKHGIEGMCQTIHSYLPLCSPETMPAAGRQTGCLQNTLIPITVLQEPGSHLY